MKKLILLPLLCGLAGGLFAQSALTAVSDTITYANGSHPSGVAIISWQRALNDANPRQIIAQSSVSLPIMNGVVSISLFPNTAMLPVSTCYGVSYSWSTGGPPVQRYWYIPVSASPVTLQQIEGSIACNTTSGPIVAPAQISPGPAGSVTVLTSSSSGYVSWLPGGGGGGSTLFSQLLSGVNSFGQTLTVGSTSILNYSGSGIVDANQVAGAAISGVSGNSGRLAESTGTLINGDLGSFDASGNLNDSAIPKANVIVNTGTYPNPAWLTTLAASKLTGLLPCASLPVFTGDASNTGCAIAVTATGGMAFAPSATTDTTNAANITSGTLAAARLPAINLAGSGAGGVTGNLPVTHLNGGSGASVSTYLRGDGTWATISNGGTVTNTFGPLTAGAVVVGNGVNDETVLSSLGTSSMVLTGNATGTPAWAQVNLATTVSGILPGANGGSGNGFFAVTGPTGALKTFTLPNASATILTNNAAVTLAQGGLGANFGSIALGGILSGTGAGVLGITTLGTNGYVLTANSGAAGGLAWTSPTSGGTVTSIACSAPLSCSPGPITATGTISGATLVTAAAALTANQLMIGGGSQASAALGSLGTTTTVLHGNGSSFPAFSQIVNGDIATGTIDLTAKVTNILPPVNGGAPYAISNEYNFAAQTPGGTLTAATPATVTLAPCPLGVAGTNIIGNGTFEYLYLSAGTGTAEAVPVTGGTCTSGASSGTITFTPANSHSGAWTITSATAGIQEALNVSLSVKMPCNPGISTTTIHGPFLVDLQQDFFSSGQTECTIQYSGSSTLPPIVHANSGTGIKPDIYPGSLHDFRLIGASTIGILTGGDPAGVITPTTWAGDGAIVHNVNVAGFGTAAQFGNNTYGTVWESNLFDGCSSEICGSPGSYGVQFGTIAAGFTITSTLLGQPITAERFSNNVFQNFSVSAIRDNAAVNVTFTGDLCQFSTHCIYVGNTTGSNISWIGGAMIGYTDNASGMYCSSTSTCGTLLDFAIAGNLNLFLSGGTYGYEDSSVTSTSLFNFSNVARLTLEADGISLAAATSPLTLTNVFNIVTSDPAHSKARISLQHGTQGFEPTYTNVVNSSTLTNWTISGLNGETCFDCANPATTPYIVFSKLPSCATALTGITAAVQDSMTTSWGATITGSGSDKVGARCSGTAWTVFAQ